MSVSSVTPASSVVVILPAVVFALGWGAPIAFLAAGLLCVPLAYCYSSLGRRFPSAGGEYAFARRFFGSGVARATWATTVLGVTLAIAAMIQGASHLVAGIVGTGAEGWWALAVCAVVLLVAPQRVRHGAWITTVMLVLEIAAVIGIAAVGIVAFIGAGTSLEDCVGAARSSLAGLDVAHILPFVAVAYFALAGFGSAIIFGEEDLAAGGFAARAVGWTLAVAFALEFGPLIALLFGTRCGPVAPTGGSGLLDALSGSAGSPALQAAVLATAAIACVNAAIVIAMQAARMVYSAARDDLLPDRAGRRLGRIRVTTRTPLAATIAVAAGAGLIAMLLPSDRVIAVASAALIVPPAVVAASRLAWRSGPGGLWRRWLPPVVAIAALSLVGGFGIAADPWAFAVPAASWAAGLGYDRWTRGRVRQD